MRSVTAKTADCYNAPWQFLIEPFINEAFHFARLYCVRYVRYVHYIYVYTYVDSVSFGASSREQRIMGALLK